MDKLSVVLIIHKKGLYLYYDAGIFMKILRELIDYILDLLSLIIIDVNGYSTDLGTVVIVIVGLVTKPRLTIALILLNIFVRWLFRFILTHATINYVYE